MADVQQWNARSIGSWLFRRWAWLLLPIACHFGFSWIGFNPTDDGWLQAVARRLLDGQVPHRDFIFVRPALSAILQVPLVWLGGDRVIWWSRLWGWLTLGAAIWLWAEFATAAAPLGLKYLLYAAALFVSAHNFPIMAWHTLDGILLCSIAVGVALRSAKHRYTLAFLLVGMAGLCRQNFGLFAPLLLIGVGGPVRSWFTAGFWSLLPVAVYTTAMLSLGGARDFVQQIFAPTHNFSSVAISDFVHEAWFLAVVPVGLLLAIGTAATGRYGSRFSAGMLGTLFAAVGLTEAYAIWHFPWIGFQAAFAMFGLVLGGAIVALRMGVSAEDRILVVGGLGLTWVVSISLGYNNPALMSGVLLLLWWRLLHLLLRQRAISRLSLTATLIVAPAAAFAFSHIRIESPYRDAPAGTLRYDVGDVLAGGAGLRTNATTYQSLADLQRLKRQLRTDGHGYVLLTDFPAFWIRDPQPNPLSCEWPQETELAQSRALIGQMLADLQHLPPNSRIILQKFLVSQYAWRVIPVPSNMDFYFLQNWVRSHCTKVAETTYFEIYLPPAARTVVPSR